MTPRQRNERERLLAMLQASLPSEVLPFLPRRWYKIGDILIISLSDKKLQSYRETIGKAYLACIPNTRTVLARVGPTKGIIRTPSLEFLAGAKNTETIHKELGCQFKLDAAKLTFSPGNHGERKRLISLVSDGEFIIDMFSCVGNLSLPVAVRAQPQQIIAAEINPLAFKYLLHNIQLNNVSHLMQGVLGDNRITLQKYLGKADRVLMGYFDSDRVQLELAFGLVKKGGIIHCHRTIPDTSEGKEQAIYLLEETASLSQRTIDSLSLKNVKKYGPNVDHIVIDILVN